MSERLSSTERGYGWRWQKARLSYLRKRPLCVMCADLGRISPATVVDHKTPHRGDQVLFWSESNWQSLCKPCHDQHKQQIESKGFDVACGIDGWPRDPLHPANRKL